MIYVKNSANKILALAILGVTLIFSRAGYCDDKLNIAVTHPWLALLAQFIGGPEVNVIPIKTWNSNGALVNGSSLRELDKDAKVIALDDNDAASAGINAKNNFTVKYLYSPFPVDVNALYDPSVIPFVAQRVLTVLSEWDAQNYLHYQRRLAEFQARMSSSILVGQVLTDMKICDMGGYCGVLLRAAGAKVDRSDKFEQWQKGNFAGLREYLDAQRSEGVAIVIDDDTPSSLRKYLAGRSDVYKWERPTLDRDYPTFLHEQYISLWQKITSKPLPGKRGKR